MSDQEKPAKIRSDINYYVVGAMFVGIIVFTIGNSIEPEDDETLDFYEASILIGFAAATAFGFNVARRYWGSKIFGRAYLSLCIGYGAYFEDGRYGLFTKYFSKLKILIPIILILDILLFIHLPFTTLKQTFITLNAS